MTAGNYVIVCNLAGHYQMGMRAPFIVHRPTTTVNVTLGDTSGVAGPMTSDGLAQHRARRRRHVRGEEHRHDRTRSGRAEDRTSPTTSSRSPTAATRRLPSRRAPTRSSEDTNIGETGDPNLKPGDTRTFTIKNMTAGNYVIVCNLAGHYQIGMGAPFTVG